MLFRSSRSRGLHLITDEVLKALHDVHRIDIGILHLFIRHTSASLTLNENASPEVRRDLDQALDRIVPEGPGLYQHTLEGPDDMPAHIKSSLMGASLSIPIAKGRLLLGTWQGIYLCEHRNHGGAREIVATILGD